MEKFEVGGHLLLGVPLVSVPATNKNRRPFDSGIVFEFWRDIASKCDETVAGVIASCGCPIGHGDALREAAIDESVSRVVRVFDSAYNIVDIGQIVSNRASSVLSSHPIRDDMVAGFTIEAMEALNR